MSGYDVAQICRNGHVTAKFAIRYPQFRQDFCDKCGEPTIMACPSCQRPIRGAYWNENVIGVTSYDRPGFCIYCGSTFPWTERKLAAAKELAGELPTLTPEERVQLQDLLPELLRDSPKTPLAQSRFKMLVGKAGSEALAGMRAILTDVVSEVVKKSIFGP